MSNADGWPSWSVDVEPLPDRRWQLWLEQDGTRTPLGTLDGLLGCYPVVEARVQEQLGLVDADFVVELRIPQPPYVHDGDRVEVTLEDGRRAPGTVISWVNGEVWIEVHDDRDGGSGLFSPEEVTFPAER